MTEPCAVCDALLPMDGTEHLVHDLDCDRFLAGSCRCDRWSCAGCCRECAPPTPRAQVLAVVNQWPQVPVASTSGLTKRSSGG